MCSLSVGGFLVIRSVDSDRLESEAQSAVDVVATRLGSELAQFRRSITNAARTVAIALTVASARSPQFKPASRAAFMRSQAHIVNVMSGLVERYPYVAKAGVCPRVNASDVGLLQRWLEDELRTQRGSLNLSVTLPLLDYPWPRPPPPPREEYYPITYMVEREPSPIGLMRDPTTTPPVDAVFNATVASGSMEMQFPDTGARTAAFPDRLIVMQVVTPCNSSSVPDRPCVEEAHNVGRVLGVLAVQAQYLGLLSVILPGDILGDDIGVQLIAPNGVLLSSWRWPPEDGDLLLVKEVTVMDENLPWVIRVAIQQQPLSPATELSSIAVFAAGLTLSAALLAFVLHSFRRIDQLTRKRIQADKEHVAREEATKREALVRFMRATSHDMRTPLHALTMALDELVHSFPHLADDAAFASSQSSVSMLELVVDNVLDVNRVERGELQLDWVQCPLSFMQERALSLIRAATMGMDVSKVRIEVNAPKCAEQLVCKCDRARILRSVQNVVVNARKFTQRGSIIIDCACFKNSIGALKYCSRMGPAAPAGSSASSSRMWKHPAIDPVAGERPSSDHQQEAANRQHETVYLCFCVRDSGQGMSAPEVEACVKPFVFGPQASLGGTGLGLHVVLASVLAHQGVLCIRSARGVGTAVTMCFPAEVVTGAECVPSTRGTSTSTGTGVSGRDAAARCRVTEPSMAERRSSSCQGATATDCVMMERQSHRSEHRMPAPLLQVPVLPELTQPVSPGVLGTPCTAPYDSPPCYWVLVVDDQPLNARLLSRQLERLGRRPLRVDVAYDGLEALNMVRQRNARGGAGSVSPDGTPSAEPPEPLTPTPYRLVFMDMNMPTWDGLQSTRSIRALGAAIAQPRIVMLTGNATTADRDEAAAAGVDAFEAKPCPKEHLAQYVSELVL